MRQATPREVAAWMRQKVMVVAYSLGKTSSAPWYEVEGDLLARCCDHAELEVARRAFKRGRLQRRKEARRGRSVR